MVTEQRVISSKPRIGARSTSPAPSPEEPPEPPRHSRRTLAVLLVLLVLVAGAGAGYWFFLAPQSGTGTAAEPAAEPAPEPGAVLVVDSISINLSGGHYLRLGLGLQLTKDVGEEQPDTARALDLAIELFSQRSVEEVSDLAQRAALKTELVHQLDEAYEGEVMDVYFTDFVTQ